MKKDLFALLALLATAALPVVATQGSKPAQVNQFAAPVLLQNTRINYQQHELQQQRATGQIRPAQTRRQATHLTTNNRPNSSSSNNSLQQVFESFALGQGIGVNGLLHGDYNNDNLTDLVLANPMSIVFAGMEQGKFRLQKQLAFSWSIGKLVYFRDLSTDGHYAFFSVDNQLQKLDLISRQVVATHSFDSISSYQLVTTADQQTTRLLLTDYAGQVHVVEPDNLQTLRSQAGINASIATVGAFTAADRTEVLFDNGQIYNFADNSLTLEKTLILDNAAFRHAVDVNGDGLAEILSAQRWYSLTLMSPLTEAVLWSKQTELDINALVLADLDQDGRLDGVYGDGQWGNLYAFDLQTGNNFWSISNPEHGVTNIVVADLDNDGSLDVGWGAGYSSSGADYFYIHDVATKQLKWQSEDIGFPAAAVTLADVDRDGDIDAVTVSLNSDSGYNGGVIQVFDIQTNTRLWHGIAANNWGGTMNLLAADLDNDSTTELVIGSSEIYAGLVRVLNAADGTERFRTLLGNGDNVSALLLSDLNDDGISDIIVGNGAEHSGSDGVFFTVLDGASGNIIQKSPSLGFYWQGLTDLQILSGNDSRYIYGLLNNNLYQYNYSNNTVTQLTNSAEFQHLTTVVTAGETRLLATDYNGNLLQLSANGAINATTPLCQGNISGLTGTFADTLLYSCGDSLVEYNLATASNNFVQTTGFNSNSDPQSVRHNGKTLHIVGGDKVVVYQAEAPQALPAPVAVNFSSHVLSALTGTLQMPVEVDYFMLANGTKLGQLSFTDRKNGQFSYQPRGTTGIETVKYYAVKGSTSSVQAELTIELTNATPVADDLQISSHWNSAVQFTLTAQDADAEALQFTVLSQPQFGQVQLLDAAQGTAEYRPSGDNLAPVSFSFVARDSLVTSTAKNVTITLTNTAPVGLANRYQTSYLTPVNGALQGSDADGDAIVYEISSQPTHGNLTLDSDSGLFVYTPTGNTNQTVSFSFVVKDKFASSAAQTVTIQVQGENTTADGSSGGSIGIYSMFALLLLALRRRQR